MKITTLLYFLIKTLITKGNLTVCVAHTQHDGHTCREEVDEILTPPCRHQAKELPYIELWANRCECCL